VVILHTAHDRSIHEPNTDGSLEIIDDLGISKVEVEKLRKVFTIPMCLVTLTNIGADIWRLLGEHTDALEQSTLFILPGNGAWLVERALKSRGIDPNPKFPVDISRDTTSDIDIDSSPDHIVVIEDVVETGNTSVMIRKMIGKVDCPVTLATTLWHDRAPQTKHVLDAYDGFDNVLVGMRIRSSNELDDVRSLSTLARKAGIPKNQRYSLGLETSFLQEMVAVLDRHAWVHQLGISIGYRRDEVS